MSVLRPVELRDLARIEGLAREVIEQCGHLRRNMADRDTYDRIRYGLIDLRAAQLRNVTLRCERRYRRMRDKGESQ